MALELYEVMCPICLDVFVEPITLCCKHELCKQCYDEHFTKADFRCPLCKMRLSSWARKQAKCGTMVNTEKWKQIQKQYASLLEMRKSGKDSCQSLRTTPVVVAEPGEIKKEYLRQKEEWDCARKEEDHQQEQDSLNFIKKMLMEDTKEEEERKRIQLQHDQEFATELFRQMNPPRKKPVLVTPPKKPVLRSSQSKKNSKQHSIQRYFTHIQKKKSSLVHQVSEHGNASSQCSSSRQ